MCPLHSRWALAAIMGIESDNDRRYPIDIHEGVKPVQSRKDFTANLNYFPNNLVFC